MKVLGSGALALLASSTSMAFTHTPAFVKHSLTSIELSKTSSPPSGGLYPIRTTTLFLSNSDTTVATTTMMEEIKVPASAIRNSVVTRIDGESVTIGEAMGPGSNVVVFLRHMGWPYCWSYAQEWCERLQQQPSSTAEGEGNNAFDLLFVSIGDVEKLNAFLDLNPFIPRGRMLVDGYEFGAYKNAGLGRIDEQDPEVAKAVTMSAPTLGLGTWWKYLTNVAKMSPIPPRAANFGSGIPEGVLRLGATFVIKGDEVLYQWSDRLPGDHPDVSKVAAIATAEAM